MGHPVGPNEIYINGTYFPIRGPVRLQNIAVPGQPIAFGDTSNQSSTQAMDQIIQSNFNGGSGLYIGNARTDGQRFYDSQCDTVREFLGAPDLVSTGSGNFGAAAITMIAPFVGAADGVTGLPDQLLMGTALNIYKVEGNGVVTLTHALPGGVVKCSDSAFYAGSLYVAYGGTGGYCQITAGVGYVDQAGANPTFLAVWDNKLWGLCGPTVPGLQWTLKFSTNGVAWTAKTAVLSGVNVTRLLVWRDSTGNPVLYAVTDRGLWVYDATNDRWLQTEVNWAPDPTGFAGAGAFVWPRDGRLYVNTGGMGVIALTAGTPIQVQPVGMDLDYGVPAAQVGDITAMHGDVNFIYALVKANSTYITGGGTQGSVRRYNGQGWHTLYLPNTANFQGQPIQVLNQGGNYRLVFAQTDGVNVRPMYVDLPRGVFNPRVNTNVKYQVGSFNHITPWWFGGNRQRPKIHGHIFIEVENCDAVNYVQVYGGTGLNDNTLTLLTLIDGGVVATGKITTNGLHDLNFVDQVGVQDRYFRYKIVITNSASTSTPRVRAFTSEMMPVLPPTLVYIASVDLSKSDYHGVAMSTLRNTLIGLTDPTVIPNFYPISYWDQLDGVQKDVYGRVSRLAGSEETGADLRGQGQWIVTLVVPYKQDTL